MARLFLALAGALALLVAAAPAQTPITVGQTISAELAAGDSQLPDGEYYDEFVFEAETGLTYSIRLESEDIDCYLILIDPSGSQTDNDDFDGTNSGIDIELDEAGECRIGATSYSVGETGAYTLSLRAGAPPEPTGPMADGGPIAVGQAVTGQLAMGDETLATGEYHDTYTIEVEDGQSLMIRLTSEDFDTYLMFIDSAGAHTTNDDMGDSTNSGIDIEVAEGGECQIGVTSFRPGETGTYVLSVE